MYGAKYLRMDKVKIAEDSLYKKSKVMWSASADHVSSNFFKAVLHKFYLVDS